LKITYKDSVFILIRQSYFTTREKFTVTIVLFLAKTLCKNHIRSSYALFVAKKIALASRSGSQGDTTYYIDSVV
jgi:hypothetical protein